MKITEVSLRNFRRLEDVKISFEENETVFVGPNNSGKTSATAAFRLFLVRPDFRIHDFSVSTAAEFLQFGLGSDAKENSVPSIEMDIWFSIDPSVEFGRVFSLIPNVTLSPTEVGVRLSFCVKDADALFADYASTFPPRSDEKIESHFHISCQCLEILADILDSHILHWTGISPRQIWKFTH